MPGRLVIIGGLLSFSIAVLSGHVAFSQSLVLRNATLSAAGSSVRLVNGDQHYQVQQSIGQPGVIGIFTSQGLTLRQGFIQPPERTGITLKEQALVKIYPNPFSQTFVITLPDEPTGQVLITLSDLVGRTVITQWTSSLSTQIESLSLAPGHYILKILSPGNQYIVKLVKE